MPRWKHGCSVCRFIDTVKLNQTYDVYECERSAFGSLLIARYGDGPSEYTSVPQAILLARVDEILVRSDLYPYEQALIVGFLRKEHADAQPAH